MDSYMADDVCVLAKRHHNTRRTYLLVNPLQAKHLPVSPSKSLEMMSCLGGQIAKKYPFAKLVIGFAETATAIAAVVAGCLGDGCKYIHTTRESYADLSDWLYFDEEHSHAVEQKLYIKEIAKWISASPQIIFVDDEISTGKTLINIIEQLKEKIPEIKGKQIVAASIINRLSFEHEARFAEKGIKSEFLVRLNGEDFTEAVRRFEIESAKAPETEENHFDGAVIYAKEPLMDPRLGVEILKYKQSCELEAEKFSKRLLKLIKLASNVLVLGTEECMYPAMVLGKELEGRDGSLSVRCQATTRSPIGICADPSYPIHSGYKLRSFFDDERETFIYNLSCYDMAVILTDTTKDDHKARMDISKALEASGCTQIVFIEGGGYV